MAATRTAAQGIVPQGQTLFYQRYASPEDSTATRFFSASYADSMIYTDVDSFVVRREDLTRARWSANYQDGLAQWFRNSDPGDPAANVVELAGFQRPGLRVFYEPPLPWMASANALAAGDTTWTWKGRIWPVSGTGLPDSLVFTAEAQEPVLLSDGSSPLGWRVRVEGPASSLALDSLRLDLAGRILRPEGGLARFGATTSWFGSFDDGSGRWLLLKDGQVSFLRSQATPTQRESMGSWRARYLRGRSTDSDRLNDER
jgi:hypothetical protein